MSKLERKNQARQKLRLKRQAKSDATGLFSGQHGAARHIAVVPLAYGVDTAAAISQFNESVDAPNEPSQDGAYRVRVDRFKQNVAYIPAKMDLVSALDVCRLADFVVFVLPAEETLSEEAQLLLRSVEGQGISNVLAVVQVCSYFSIPDGRVAQSLIEAMSPGPRESHASETSAANYGVLEILYDVFLSRFGENPFVGLETRMLQYSQRFLYSNAKGHPLARRPKLDAHRKRCLARSFYRAFRGSRCHWDYTREGSEGRPFGSYPGLGRLSDIAYRCSTSIAQ